MYRVGTDQHTPKRGAAVKKSIALLARRTLADTLCTSTPKSNHKFIATMHLQPSPASQAKTHDIFTRRAAVKWKTLLTIPSCESAVAT